MPSSVKSCGALSCSSFLARQRHAMQRPCCESEVLCLRIYGGKDPGEEDGTGLIAKAAEPCRAVTKYITSQHVPRLVSQVTTFTHLHPVLGPSFSSCVLWRNAGVVVGAGSSPSLVFRITWSSRVPISGLGSGPPSSCLHSPNPGVLLWS